MSDNERELMRRYIYQVVRRLPKDQRQEIGMELEELIEDMFESKEGTIEEILLELGDPKEFAKKYQNFNYYLISPEYFDNYVWILKIVLLCVGISTLLSEIVSFDYHTFHYVEFIIELTVNTLVSLVSSFGMVTLVFAIFEHMQIQVDVKNQEDWSPEQLKNQEDHRLHNEDTTWNPIQLAPIPDKRAIISRGETLVGIVFILILSVLFVFAPKLLGVYVFEENQLSHTIPIFNLDKWNILCPLLLAGLLIGFIDEIIKLISGCYNNLVLVSCIVTNSIQLILATIVLKFLPLWNANFVKELSKNFDYVPKSKEDILFYWGTDTPSNIVLAIIFAFTFIEIFITIYKTIRYKTT